MNNRIKKILKSCVHFVLVVLFILTFLGCEKDTSEDDKIEGSILTGTWLEQSSEESVRITFTDETAISEIFVEELGVFVPYEEATYTSTMEENIITINAEIVKMNMIMIGGEDEYVEFPYTDMESGITYQSISEIICFVIDTSNNPTIALIPTVRPYRVEACFGGDMETLLGEWHSTLTRIRVLEVEGEPQVKTLTINFGNTLDIESYVIHYTYEEMNYETGVSEEITETALWEHGLDNTFMVTAGEENRRLISGTYRYMIAGNGISISAPQEIGGTAEYPTYFKKVLD